ncbi:acyl-CoA mutase large subunit family protein [Alkalihalobacillus oceani]|uniref:Acyl-CoA mutase large subunit family protein n=1 Tax=Halalkalibacter oceani TaxID=1653776 RepID=A0A9X2DTE3_9BACI|nr:methylmalonyl-CoA mutase family protein [Halalkalibacter oceani]MCM3715152.1 acyl-CoA mutase large subunit family protein [Halalkalibacter oceani]
MTMEKNDVLSQFSEFPTPSYEEWQQVTEKSLKGKSFETLLTTLPDGIVLKPMYQRKDVQQLLLQDQLPGQFPFTRGTRSKHSSWLISQALSAATPKQLNEELHQALAAGQEVLHIAVAEEVKRGNIAGLETEQVGGVPIFDLDDMRELFSAIEPSRYPLYLDAGEIATPFLAALALVSSKEGKPLFGVVGADPLHVLAKYGRLTCSLAEAYKQMALAVRWASNDAPGLRTVLVQAHHYHNGGASAAMEVACALATGAEYVAALIDSGLTADEAGSAIAFSFSVGSDYFTEIAKLRAARTLWAAIMAEFGAGEEAQKMIIHARTSLFTKTAEDRHVNLLRATSEAFAAAVAGVDSIEVSPFDEALQQTTSFSRRIARNTSLILREEAHIGQTIDPSGGSWYVEHVTEELAKKIWKRFLEIDEAGGIVEALQRGVIQDEIEAMWKKRVQQVETRKQVIVGNNQYINLMEKEDSVTPRQEESGDEYAARVQQKLAETKTRITPPQTLAEMEQLLEEGIPFSTLQQCLKQQVGSGAIVTPIPQRRLAEPYEKLRHRSRRLAAKQGAMPAVLIVGLGALADYKTRADFIAGFFQCGGFDVRQTPLHAPEQDDFFAQCQMIVLCGHDEAYEKTAPGLIENWRSQAAAKKYFIAGRPDQSLTDKLKQAGLDGMIDRRTNAYTFLYALQDWLKGGDDE